MYWRSFTRVATQNSCSVNIWKGGKGEEEDKRGGGDEEESKEKKERRRKKEDQRGGGGGEKSAEGLCVAIFFDHVPTNSRQ